jgi:hypothetical protein
VALYPRAWRARYGDELEALLDVAPPGLRDRFDLLRVRLESLGGIASAGLARLAGKDGGRPPTS